MDKLAKRAGVTLLIALATAGSAFAWGLARFAGSADRDDTPKLRLGAALKVPKRPVMAAAVAPPSPAAVALAAPPASLANAFSNALVGTPRKKPVAPAPAPERAASDSPEEAPFELPRAEDLLNFGPGGHEREAKLGERSASAFTVRQPGGAEQAHKPVKDSGERVTFETDLGRPGDH